MINAGLKSFKGTTFWLLLFGGLIFSACDRKNVNSDPTSASTDSLSSPPGNKDPDTDETGNDQKQNKDSITILEKVFMYGDTQVAFVQHNRNSDYYNFSNVFRKIEGRRKEEYVNEYLKEKEKFQDSVFVKGNLPDEIIGKWIPVYFYKGDPYTARTSSFYIKYEVTDSTFITYDQDGAFPALFFSVIRQGDRTILSSTAGDVIFEPWAGNKAIFQCTQGRSKKFLINISNAKAIPVIVKNYSSEGVEIIKFDPGPTF